MYIYVEKLIGNYTLKIMKNTWKFTKKPGKIMEISWNFVSPEKWEPWCLLPGGCLLLRGVCSRGGGIPACTEADLPSPGNRMTDRQV